MTRRSRWAGQAHYGSLGHTDNPEQHLHDLDRTVTDTHAGLADTRRAIEQLTAAPAITALPNGQLAHEHEKWRTGYHAERELAQELAMIRAHHNRPPITRSTSHHQVHQPFEHDNSLSIDGPSIGH